jgi:hypothetical protein
MLGSGAAKYILEGLYVAPEWRTAFHSDGCNLIFYAISSCSCKIIVMASSASLASRLPALLVTLLGLVQLCYAAGLSSLPNVTQLLTDAAAVDYVAASYYPTPWGGWDDSWAEAYDKATDLVAQMTLAEKTNLTSGTGFFMGSV